MIRSNSRHNDEPSAIAMAMAMVGVDGLSPEAGGYGGEAMTPSAIMCPT